MGYKPQKVQKKRNSYNAVKTAQRPSLKELRALLENLDFNHDFGAKSGHKNRIH